MSTLHITLAVPLPQIAYAHGSISGSYTLAGSFTQGLASIIITSTLDAAVQLSFDGTNDHIAVPAGSTTPVVIPINFTNNRSTMSPTSIFVKQIASPSAGTLYVSGFSRT